MQKLDRDVAPDDLVRRAVHHAHATATDLVFNEITTRDRAAEQGVLQAHQVLAVDRADLDFSTKARSTTRALVYLHAPSYGRSRYSPKLRLTKANGIVDAVCGG